MLPKIPVANYTLSTKVNKSDFKFKYTPYTVAHESIIAMAKEGTKEEQMDAIKQVLEYCITEDISTIPMSILELLFIYIHGKSVGEIINLKYRCNHLDDGVPCEGVIEFELNYMDFDMQSDPDFKDVFELGGGIGIKFKLPTIEMVDTVNSEMSVDTMNNILVSCVDSIFSGQEVYSDNSKEELSAFLETITPIMKIEIFKDFVLKLPHIHFSVDITCPKCNTTHKIQFNSLTELFK